MASIKFDIHTHTIASGHGSHATITDMAKTASARGIKILGISDHGPATSGGGKPSYFRSLSHAPRERFHVEMLYGAEVNILDNAGTLDLSDDILSNLDYAIASLHNPVKKPGSIDENTRCYLMAMKNPYVRIIGHCDDANYPIDYSAVVNAAIESHVLLEINEQSLCPDGYRGNTYDNALTILKLCKSYSYPVILSSDSHGTAHIGEFIYAGKLVRTAGMPEHLILNHSADALRDFLHTRS